VFAQTAAGNLVFLALGTQPGVSHGQLKNFRATLDGAVTLEPANGFQPKAGDAFEFLTYGSRQGMFSSHIAPAPPQGLDWVPEYASTSFRLKLSTPLPPPDPNDPHGAVGFDGLDDFAEVPHTDSLNAYPLTIMAWVAREAAASLSPKALSSKYVNALFNGYASSSMKGRVYLYFPRWSNYIWDGGSGARWRLHRG
jgi:hypothetical protein